MKACISVIVPVYNGQTTIEKCITSIINQTIQNIEIIIINDGSTDNTGAICDQLALKDNRIRVKHQKNLGLLASREQGLMIAKGDYICFVDSDDWCEYDMFETLYHYANNYKVDIVYCSAYVHLKEEINSINNIPIKNGLYKVKDLRDSYLMPLFGKLNTDPLKINGYMWCCMYKKTVMQQLKFYYDVTLHEDETLMIQILMNSNEIYVTDKKLYHYNRTNEDSMSNKSKYMLHYWDNIINVCTAKIDIAHNFSINENDYMYRLITLACHKYLRSIRNETHYKNPKGFFGGLYNAYHLENDWIFSKYHSYILKGDFTKKELLFIKFIKCKLTCIVYFYYAIIYDRMKKFNMDKENLLKNKI